MQDNTSKYSSEKQWKISTLHDRNERRENFHQIIHLNSWESVFWGERKKVQSPSFSYNRPKHELKCSRSFKCWNFDANTSTLFFKMSKYFIKSFSGSSKIMWKLLLFNKKKHDRLYQMIIFWCLPWNRLNDWGERSNKL